MRKRSVVLSRLLWILKENSTEYVYTILKSDFINNMNNTRISGTEPSSVILMKFVHNSSKRSKVATLNLDVYTRIHKRKVMLKIQLDMSKNLGEKRVYFQ